MTSGGDPCRCPRLALSSSGALPRTVGFLECPVGNQQFEVLLAEGNLIDGLYAVATASRPTVGSPRSILEAALNALAASGIQCVLNFSASHDSQCCIVFHTPPRCCFPLHSASHGCLVARIGHRVRGHRYCLWCRNRRVPQRPQLQRWHVHRILRAFRGFFNRAQLALVSSPTHASLRYSAFPTTFEPCVRLAEQNLASLCSR